MKKELYDDIKQYILELEVEPYDFVIHYKLEELLGKQYDNDVMDYGAELLYHASFEGYGKEKPFEFINTDIDRFIKLASNKIECDEFLSLYHQYIDDKDDTNYFKEYIDNNYKSVKIVSLKENDAWNYDFALMDIKGNKLYRDKYGDRVFFDGTDAEAETYFKKYCELNHLSYMDDTSAIIKKEVEFIQFLKNNKEFFDSDNVKGINSILLKYPDEPPHSSRWSAFYELVANQYGEENTYGLVNDPLSFYEEGGYDYMISLLEKDVTMLKFQDITHLPTDAPLFEELTRNDIEVGYGNLDLTFNLYLDENMEYVDYIPMVQISYDYMAEKFDEQISIQYSPDAVRIIDGIDYPQDAVEYQWDLLPENQIITPQQKQQLFEQVKNNEYIQHKIEINMKKYNEQMLEIRLLLWQ